MRGDCIPCDALLSLFPLLIRSTVSVKKKKIFSFPGLFAYPKAKDGSSVISFNNKSYDSYKHYFENIEAQITGKLYAAMLEINFFGE